MILFKAVRWKNFLSTGGHFTEIKLNKSPNTLITGENGAGKSTFEEAICFGLFGRPFRDINKNQLVNSVNQKQCVVEIEFSIGDKEYKVVRGIKPNIFDIIVNGQLLNQDASVRDYQRILEESILKLNYKSFTQIVILGSASFTPFMRLPAAHRREVIEDLLDIQIFTVMNRLLKDQQSAIRLQIVSIENELINKKNAVSVQQSFITTLEESKRKHSTDILCQIETTRGEIARTTETILTTQNEVEELERSIDDLTDLQQKQKKLQKLNELLVDKIKKAQEEIDFYSEHSNCPTCNQTLSTDLKQQAIHQHTTKASEIDQAIVLLSTDMSAIQTRLANIEEVNKNIRVLNKNIFANNNSIIAAQQYITKLEADINKAKEDTTDIDKEKGAVRQLAKEVIGIAKGRSVAKEEQQYLDACSTLLKDTGIKTKIIRQYLPVINKLVNKYLNILELFVHFELDETFVEVIKSRHRDEFSYASFSEGEKARIDIALLLTFRTVAKMKNTVNTNLLILDEVFDSSLDVIGSDYVMSLLNAMGEESNIFVISHRDQLFDKFRSAIRFVKKNNFSAIG